MVGARRLKQWLFVIGVIPVVSFGCSKLRDFEDIANKKNQQVNANYPHTSEFRTTRSHGAEFQKDPKSCKTCHGENLTGGNTKVSCNQCHAQYPHDDTFKTTAQHGDLYLLASNKNDCLRCHGTKTLAENSKATNCQSCHSYPHESLWNQRDNHGAAYLKPQTADTQQKVTCKSCHGEDLSGGNSKVACNQCHIQYPHAAGFKPIGQSSGTHGATFLGLSNRSGCYRCHDIKELENPQSKNATACQSCHSYPHEGNWTSPENHGTSFVAQLKHDDNDALEKTSCGKCHGNKEFAERNSKRNLVNCDKCHLTMPHNADFKSMDHAEKAKSFTVACKSCHKNLKDHLPNQEGKGCLNCHSDGDGVDKGPKIEFPL